MIAAALATFFLGQAALAQTIPDAPLPPESVATDANGVNFLTGAFEASTTPISVGPPGAGGLTYSVPVGTKGRQYHDSFIGTLNIQGTNVTISLFGTTRKFSDPGSGYEPTDGRGGALTNFGNQWNYDGPDGSVAVFDQTLDETTPIGDSSARITGYTTPNNERLTFNYEYNPFLSGPLSGDAIRVLSINSNLGYQIKYDYVDTAFDTADAEAWLNPSEVTLVNNAVEYCASFGLGCSGLTGNWPTVQFARTATTLTVTDAEGRQTIYTYGTSGTSDGKLTAIRWPGSVSDNITISYDAQGNVDEVNRGSDSWTYSFVSANWSFPSTVDITVTGPHGTGRTARANWSTDRVGWEEDKAGRRTTYTYDSDRRLTRVTRPGGDANGGYTNYTYDSRGNVTETRVVAFNGSGLADIVTSATYPATCTHLRTCNQPITTTDARGEVTNFYYNTGHGGVTSVVAPAPGLGADRPETRFGYAAIKSWTRNAGGVLIETPTAVWTLIKTTHCTTGASPCINHTREIVTDIAYEPGSASVQSNILPISVTVRAGDSSVSATTTTTYDDVANAISVDGPLAGTADTSHVFYNDMRQVEWTVSADPDGAGPRKRLASKTTYNATSGLVTEVEQGTVNGPTLGDLASFVSLEKTLTTYDSQRRPSTVALMNGGARMALTQYSYDQAGRIDCIATRMNAAAFTTLPASACTLGTQGSEGPDRIVKNQYSTSNEILKVIAAYGTVAQKDDMTATYSATTGVQTTVVDGNGNKTTYEYDGFNRPKKTRFPEKVTAGASSTTDYEELWYEAGSGLITKERRRDGAEILFEYDDLARLTKRNLPPGEADVEFTYDSAGRQLTISHTGGDTLTYVHDALNRVVSETGPLGAVTYEYDAASRRTKTTYPTTGGGGAFYVDYDYDTLGLLTHVRENGAASGIGVLASYAYDALARRETLTRGNGVITTYTYDSISRLKTLAHDVQSVPDDDDLTITLGYTVASQIKNRIASNASYVQAPGTTFLEESVFNGLNQLRDIGLVAFGYDARGNMTSGGAQTYGYDTDNRLISATGGATFDYDPLGRLAEMAKSGATTKFLYDGAQAIAEYDGTTTMLRRYVFGVGLDEPLVWYEGAGTADRRWLIADERGSVVAVTGASGASIATNTYDAYGVPAVGNIGRYQYTGQMWLGEAGLYFYKTRVYDPNIGRFLQTDPIGYGGGMNMYAYVGGDPINNIDPWGLCDYDSCVTITGTRPSSGIDPFFFDSLLWQLQLGPYAPFDTADFGIAGGVAPTDEVVLAGFFSPTECDAASYAGAAVAGGSIGALAGGAYGAAGGTFVLPGGGTVALGGGGAVVGGVGGAAVATFGVAAQCTAQAIHANSANFRGRPTEVYHLLNRTTGDIDKIGITSRPGSRYSQPFLDANNVDYVTIQQYNWRYPAMVHENIALTHHFITHGSLPRLNKGFR